MKKLFIPINKATAIRLLFDAVMINVALLSAYLLRMVISIRSLLASGGDGQIAAAKLLGDPWYPFWRSTIFLTPIALVLFWTSGFYTHGRAYRGRYKALIIVQAVTLAYVILGFLSYLQVVPPASREAWLVGWVLTLALVGGGRLGVFLWTETSRMEERLLRQTPDAPVRRVLVIGGAGYVGSALVRQLLVRGYGVRVLDLLLYGDRAMQELQSHARFEFVRGDFRNIETVVRCVRDVDAVVHLGAIVGDSAGDLKPEITYDVNVAATRLIAEVARGYGVRRFVFTSTCGVYGASDQLLDERSEVNAMSLYARSKLASEEILLGLTDNQFSPVILRYGTLFGLSYRPRFDLVVNLLTAKAVMERAITIINGDQWRPFLHVEDAARAIVQCLESSAGAIAGQVFDVGSLEENHQLKGIAALVCDVIPGTKVTFVENDGPVVNYRVSCKKIRERLGFQPARTVRDGIQEIKDAFDRGEIRDYTAVEYDNFKFLSRDAAGIVGSSRSVSPLSEFQTGT